MIVIGRAGRGMEKAYLVKGASAILSMVPTLSSYAVQMLRAKQCCCSKFVWDDVGLFTFACEIWKIPLASRLNSGATPKSETKANPLKALRHVGQNRILGLCNLYTKQT